MGRRIERWEWNWKELGEEREYDQNTLCEVFKQTIYIYWLSRQVSLSVLELRNTPVSSYQKFGLKVYDKVPNKNNFKRILKLF